MRIDSITIENICRIEHIELDLSACPSLTQVAGRTTNAGANSNGSGKTSLFTGIQWGLYGQDILDRAKDRIIRDGASSCRVFMTLSDKKRGTFTVERTRTRSGGLSLYINGKKGNTVTGTQSMLEQKLGFDYDLFRRTVVFGGEHASFCSMSPTQRMLLFEKMLGIDTYLNAATKAREIVKDSRVRIESLVEKKNVYYAALRESRHDLHTALDNLGESLVAHENRLSVLREQHVLLIRKSDQIWAKITANRGTAAAVEDEYKKNLAEWSARLEKAREKRPELRDKWQKAVQQYISAESALSVLESDFAALSGKSDKPKVCPACKRPFAEDRTREEHIRSEINRVKAEAAIAKQTLVQRAKLRDDLQKNIDDLDAGIREVEESRPSPPQANERIRDLERLFAENEERIRSTRRQIAELEQEDAGSWHYISAMRCVIRGVELLASGCVGEDQIRQHEHQASVAEYWVNAFSKDGLPAAVLESVAPTLDRLVHPVSEILTAGAYAIRFVNKVSDSGRSAFEVEASNIEGGSSFADLSVGERLRVDLCVLFAIRAFMQTKSVVNFDQIFIDEMFDRGIDDTGIEYVIRLLRSKRIADQVFFISHRASLRDAAEGVILLEKKDGVTRLVRQPRIHK